VSPQDLGNKKVAVLYTSVEESLAGVADETMRETMDLAVSARFVTEGLNGSGVTARNFTFGKDIVALAESFRSYGADAVFNLSECPMNSAQKEPHGAAYLELLRFPYTGNGPMALSVCNAALCVDPRPRIAAQPRLSEVPREGCRLLPRDRQAVEGRPVGEITSRRGRGGALERWRHRSMPRKPSSRSSRGPQFNVAVRGSWTETVPRLSRGACLQEPSMEDLLLRVEMGSRPSLLCGDRSSMPGRGFRRPAHSPGGSYDRMRPGLRAMRLFPRRLPHEASNIRR
jgi:hypothetical protein